MKREVTRLLEAARLRGWIVGRTRKSHWRLKHPSGAIVITAGTPSSLRTLRHTEADLRRAERRAP